MYSKIINPATYITFNVNGCPRKHILKSAIRKRMK